jgi:hypothetical protein
MVYVNGIAEKDRRCPEKTITSFFSEKVCILDKTPSVMFCQFLWTFDQ